MATERENRRPTLEADFLLLSFTGVKIEAAAHFRSPVADAYRGAQSRALVAGAKKFQVYRIDTDGAGKLKLERIEK